MSRLIDAEVAEKMLRAYADEVGCHRGEYELANGILKAVCYLENIPTSHDAKKVAEQLEEKAELARKKCTIYPVHNPLYDRHDTQYQDLKSCLEIVKGGGLNG